MFHRITYLVAAAVAAAAIGATATAADAASIRMSGATIVYAAAPAETNNVSVVLASSQQWLLSDVVTLLNGGGCPNENGSSTQVRCTILSGIPQASISLGDGNDRVDLSRAGTLFSGLVGPNQLSGGPGTDRFVGGLGADVFDGGADTDTVDYSARTVTLGITVGCNGIGFFCGPDGQKGENDDVQNSIERVIGGSANDSITAGPSARILQGGGGNDFLVGSPSNALGGDVLFGDTGADDLTPLGGADSVLGGDGNDTIHARDGTRDVMISCGGGTDFVEADLQDTGHTVPPTSSIVSADCENVDDTAVDQGPNVRIANGPVWVHNGRAQVRLSCPRSPEGRCAGTLTLRRILGTRGESATPTSPGTFRVLTRRLGSVRYQLAIGYSATLRVPAARATAGRVQATSVESDANGRPKTTLATRPLRSR